VMLGQRSLCKSCRMGRHIALMKLIRLFGHCECDSDTVHTLIQWHLTAD
jgi:hypothetical protein